MKLARLSHHHIALHFYIYIDTLYFFLKHNSFFFIETNYVASMGKAKEDMNKRRAMLSSWQIKLIIVKMVISPSSILHLVQY